MHLSWTPHVVCPLSKLKLTRVPVEKARAVMGYDLKHRAAQTGYNATPFGVTDYVMLREDGRAAYPVVDDIPILLAPEILVPSSEQLPQPDLSAPQYDEAYIEMDLYNSIGRNLVATMRESGSLEHAPEFGTRHLQKLAQLSEAERSGFPNPREMWLTSIPDIAGEAECYAFLAPLADKTVARIGGTGTHAIRLILGGARRAVVVTPMLGEALATMEMASLLGLESKISCIVGIGEELPLAQLSIDICFAAGCVHHMQTELAFPEISRVLRTGGKFAALDIWRAPFYELGIKIFGKRDPNPYCRPLNSSRIAPLFSGKFCQANCNQHGSFTRYPIIVLEKAGIISSLTAAWNISRLDRFVCELVPGAKKFGSGLSILATK